MTDTTPTQSDTSAAGRIAKAITDGSQRRERRERERTKARGSIDGYEPGIVSFIDILGFRALLATRSASEIQEVILNLREITASEEPPARRMKEVRLTSRAFADSVSDAVVRVRVYDTQFADGAFFQELLDLLHIQLQCVGTGVLIRAGVAIGDVHVGPNGKGPVFGPAMVRAFEIESEEAIFPRIVLDEDAYQLFLTDARLRNDGHELEEEVGYVDKLLRRGEDGTRFVDYLAASESEFDDFAGYLTFLDNHAAMVRNNLVAKLKPAVRRKYAWLARYHNDVIDTLTDEFENGRRSAGDFGASYDGANVIKLLSDARITTD
ncbi:hypothetical protein C8J46_103438 [Sphingomonas sp. PP-F2F-A104-K0414]|uniref:hypothetical protein n=1 Tax=Sphingomonas sp. PP-F2F-A104-K0414 TaxID=2135661 RepID=UPI0010524874|nr:hypothetical protein [Sphingomonas sp. PP-F2F-A104-K0414]TCP99550.1 hypothetical protein C8J46_103438 [Sphingomonas sp. PP-F2F-A104-K0414]